LWDDAPVLSEADWHRDARTVGVLRFALAARDADPARPMPESRVDLVAALTAARVRLRRRLLSAEGVDPRSGRPER
jgi:hypothetical protein